MRAKLVGNKADRFVHVIKNGEATATIPRGTPVILKMTDVAAAAADGLSVCLPATAGNTNSYGLRYGVATDAIAAGNFGESILFGVAPFSLITRMTRAASTDSWTSSASQASGVALGVDTLNNAFLIGASVAGSIASNGVDAILLDSLPSSTGSASATSDTRTAITNGVRTFLRMLG